MIALCHLTIVQGFVGECLCPWAMHPEVFRGEGTGYFPLLSITSKNTSETGREEERGRK